MAEFGARLKALRLQYGFTQADLAQRSHLGQSTISALETGRHSPWPSTRRTLAKAFQMTLAELDAATRPPRSVMGPGAELEESGSPVALPESSVVKHVAGTRTAATAAQDEHPFAGSKIMDLLNQLGEVEHEVSEYRSFERYFPGVAWSTDSSLHLMACLGPIAAEVRGRVGDLVGRHLRDFLDEAFGMSEELGIPLATHQMALDGAPTQRFWMNGGRRFLLLSNPIRNASNATVGAVTVALDISNVADAIG